MKQIKSTVEIGIEIYYTCILLKIPPCLFRSPPFFFMGEQSPIPQLLFLSSATHLGFQERAPSLYSGAPPLASRSFHPAPWLLARRSSFLSILVHSETIS